MNEVEPRVFLIAETKLVDELEDDTEALQAYLDWVGAPDWKTDAPSDIERLIEVGGKLCYRSFAPGLNVNVTKVTEGNQAYIKKILSKRHGSVIEHPSVTFIFANVSRVFTHELVRHRIGVAISQESLRFVRLTNLDFWFPTVFRENEEAMKLGREIIEYLEDKQRRFAEIFKLDDEGVGFDRKKKCTSAMRRFAPIGLGTAMAWSCNMRALRWILQMRTDGGAEEEIRLVFGKVAEIAIKRFPNTFQDFTHTMVDGLPQYVPANHKV